MLKAISSMMPIRPLAFLEATQFEFRVLSRVATPVSSNLWLRMTTSGPLAQQKSCRRLNETATVAFST
jgi:hypothetical protein